MASENFLKTRAQIGFAVMSLFYPLVLFLAICYKTFQYFFGQTRPKNIADDIAVVTGAAHGLGKAIAMELASKGCHVAIVDINIEEAEKTAKLINEKYDVKSKAYKVDVSDYKQVEQLNEQVTDDLGSATILVNNAGILLFNNLREPDWQEMQAMINVNLTAHFWTNRVFLKNMKKQKRGHIVAISSASSLFPLIYSGVYTSTKYAVRGLMRVLRQELKADDYLDIHGTTVFPAFLNTHEAVVKLVHKTGVSQLYPLISGEEAAARIVKGMLQCEEEIVMPGFIRILYYYFELLPSAWQDWSLVAPGSGVIKKYLVHRMANKQL